MNEPSQNRGPSLRFAKVSRIYGDVIAVDSLSFNIDAGSLVALVGASGSGKTTLLKMINRLVEPSSGDIFMDDAAVIDQAAHMHRRSIGYVFQNIGLFPHMTIAQNIAIGLKLAGREEEAASRISELLELVDLPAEYSARMPNQLSGGQQQRVGLARALATGPGLMLLDEAFGALDPVTRDNLGQEYRALHQRLGLTTILVTHDMAEAVLLADRILVLEAGKIVADATPAELVSGKAGEQAETLMAVPRGQAERLLELGRLELGQSNLELGA